jgi:predicted AlkP superfamily pyrophosphatase or phosphodiesterase
MILDEHASSIKNRTIGGTSIYPCYDGKCISNIHGTILELFGVKNTFPKLKFRMGKEIARGSTKIVLFILDGFGYNQFLRYHKHYKFLADIAEKGVVFPLTSVFPSQTTNALTTLNTGLHPQQHGLFEGFIYLKEVDAIVNTLSFETMGSKRRNDLVARGFNPHVLFKGKTTQTLLREAEIKTFAHFYISDAYSPLSKVLFQGTTIIPSLKSSDLIVKLRKNLVETRGSAYIFVHLNNLDTIAHEYGPDSQEYRAELSATSHLLDKELVEKIDRKTAEETLFLLTSDHGGVTIDPKETIYLNWFPEIVANLKWSKGGKRILPTGSPRDVFLHIEEEKLTKTYELLSQKIGTKAKILEAKHAIEKGLFGSGKVGAEFLERVGNLLILPHKNETIWFEHVKGRTLTLLGHHGGLSEDEMLLPLAITPLNILK